MKKVRQNPSLLALFEKRIEGDDSLLELARFYFKRAGLGAEYYVDAPAVLEKLFKFRPGPETVVMVHLSRQIDLLKASSVEFIMEMATKFAGRILGLVVHDQAEIISHRDDYQKALQEINYKLKGIQKGPYLFIEYAVGMKIDFFIDLFETIRDLEYISACIDIGHVGLHQTRLLYAGKFAHEDICALSPFEPRLVDVIEDVDRAVKSALPLVLQIITAFGGFNKPVHIHLHDGHPLSSSPFGISDHIGFFNDIEIPFEYNGRRVMQTMFGRRGLARIITQALVAIGPEKLSFTLEIHPNDDRLALAGAAHLFQHWEDTSNAEKMNSWLADLVKYHAFILEILDSYFNKYQGGS